MLIKFNIELLLFEIGIVIINEIWFSIILFYFISVYEILV